MASLAVRHAELADTVRNSQAELADTLRNAQAELADTVSKAIDRTQRQLEVTDRQLQETDRQQQLTDKQLRETERYLRESSERADRETRELKLQLGRLGQKFGGFTEGMALPSMQKILRQRFGMNVVSPRLSARRNGRSIEVDVLAYSNADVNEVYVVEVKSHLREEAIEQIKRIMRELRDFLPEHANKKIYGILAGVDIPEDVQRRVLREGIYLARIHDEEFAIEVPEGFKPTVF